MLLYVIYKSRTAGKDFIMTEGEPSAVFWDLNKIHLKNKIFSFRQLLGRHGFSWIQRSMEGEDVFLCATHL